MVFKCKMCDGALNVADGNRVVICDYCGSEQTLPKFDNERMLNLYDRASHYRKNNEFDKAQALYEQILQENEEDPEIYWSIILCKYGIEYVEEGGKRVPTVNRTQTTSIFYDKNYKAALQYATPEQKSVYEEEATLIDNIQKNILAISNKEEPFDIFICYKETDESGRRTLDSVLAMDLYELLTQEGYKVFYARRTLENKFGEAYEPYIFAALQSSKAMIAVGTKPEHYEAVWVKNEWSRYLALIKNGATKVMVPAYKDMDPYEMPKEFAHLQAVNMGELGFQQDLLTGIRKIFREDNDASVGKTVQNVNVAGLLDRGFFNLEEKEWETAEECFDKALEGDPSNAEAYIGKLLIDLKLTGKSELANCDTTFVNNPNYRKVIMLGNEEQVRFLEDASAQVKDRVVEALYDQTVRIYENTLFEDALIKCAEKFESMDHYKDSDAMAIKCREKAAEVKDRRQYERYQYYCNLADCEDPEKLEEAVKYFRSVKGYRDADAKLERFTYLLDLAYAQRDLEINRKIRRSNLSLASGEAYGPDPETAVLARKVTIIIFAVIGVLFALVVLANS